VVSSVVLGIMFDVVIILFVVGVDGSVVLAVSGIVGGRAFDFSSVVTLDDRSAA